MNTANQNFDYVCKLDGNGGCTFVDHPRLIQKHQGLTWIDTDHNDPVAMEWLRDESGLDRQVIATLTAGETRPRSVDVGDGFLVVLRGINMNPGAEPDDMVAVRVWISPNLIVTAHRRRVLSIVDIREALMAGAGPKTDGEFLVMLVDFLANRIGASVLNIEDALEEVEENLATVDIQDLRSMLAEQRRQIASLRRFLGPQRDALDRICRDVSPLITPNENQRLREQADHFTRYLEDLDLGREHAMVTQEELMNRVVEEQNSRMYLLSVVAAIFLPLTFVTGLLGMNVGGLPGLENPGAFLISVATMGGLGVLLVVFFRWKKWL
jgi:zinc transporter